MTEATLPDPGKGVYLAYPHGEWLLFAYSPLADRNDVTITIPGYGDATVDVPRGAGDFWLFAE